MEGKKPNVVELDGDKPLINVKVLSNFKHEASLISTGGVNQAWVSEYCGDKISLITSDGGVVKTLDTKFDIFDFETTPPGDLMITGDDGTDVKLLPEGECEFVSIIDTGPDSTLRLYTYGVGMTRTGEVLLCLFRKGESKIVRFSKAGEILQTIEYKEDEKTRIFSHPMSVVENCNGDICVVDIFSKVVVVDKTGILRFIYTGPPDPLVDKSFAPCDIQTDKYGQIIISDHDNSTIHLLDKDGNFIQYLLTRKDGLCKPRGLSIDKDGKLWLCHGEEDNKHIMIIEYNQYS